MKIFYSVIVASFLLFIGSVLPNQAYAVVCQNKTAVVYSNGMFNNQDDARIAKNKLEIKLRSYPQALNLLVDMEFYLAYADGNGGPSGTSFLAQLDEVFNQKVGDIHSLFWRWVGSVEGGPQWFQDAMTSRAGAQTELTYIADQDFQKMLNGDGSAKNPGYRKLLVDGKRVLIVSHSQGNFYANAVYTTLTTENAAWASSIGNVQVATPTAANLGGKLGNNEPQITVPEDLIMKVVHNLSLGAVMPTKPLRGNLGAPNHSPNYAELGGVIARNAATYGHNFVTWYLAGTYTRDFIMKGIVDTINGLGAYTGLQYPKSLKSCTQWPPVQTPTSWQKVLTHDWQTTRSKTILGYERRIRDDVNEMMFNAQYNWGTGVVNVQAAAFDDSVSASLPAYTLASYDPQPPQTPLVCNNFTVANFLRFQGFVPVPNGIGVLFKSGQCAPNIPADTIPMITDPVFETIVLVSHVWNKVTLSWTTTVSSLPLPRYQAFVNASVVTIPIISSYLCSKVVQIDTYKSWMQCGGGLSWGSNFINYTTLIIDNGVLSTVSTNLVFPAGLLGGTYFYEVSVPIGRYSVLQSMPPYFSSLYTLESTNGWPSRIYPIPRVADATRVDQLIIGGIDKYIIGQGVKSAPGYYQYKLLAAWAENAWAGGAGLYNQYGIKHPTKTSVGYTIASTFDDIIFFQWQ